jgi:uncharacterized protein YkwD
MGVRCIAILVALSALVLVAPASAMGAAPCVSASATPAKVAKPAIVRATLCVLNAERARYRLRPLRLNRRLSKAAGRHARDMARRKYFSHDSLGGRSFVDRIRRAGYLRGARRWSVGENLAWGTHGRSTPLSILRMWMASPGHRANILSPSFREIGIGLAYRAPVNGGARPAATYATDFGSKR